jgi:hypothetical protein
LLSLNQAFAPKLVNVPINVNSSLPRRFGVAKPFLAGVMQFEFRSRLKPTKFRGFTGKTIGFAFVDPLRWFHVDNFFPPLLLM